MPKRSMEKVLPLLRVIFIRNPEQCQSVRFFLAAVHSVLNVWDCIDTPPRRTWNSNPVFPLMQRYFLWQKICNPCCGKSKIAEFEKPWKYSALMKEKVYPNPYQSETFRLSNSLWNTYINEHCLVDIWQPTIYLFNQYSWVSRSTNLFFYKRMNNKTIFGRKKIYTINLIYNI